MMQGLDFIGRSGGIRTRDPLLPKQMRYQAALRSDAQHSNLSNYTVLANGAIFTVVNAYPMAYRRLALGRAPPDGGR